MRTNAVITQHFATKRYTNLQEMTPRAKDSLVSFGERLSTRIFAAYLRRLGVPATQFDAWDLGLMTSDEFTNAEIDYELSVPKVQQALAAHAEQHGTIPVVTGFVGRGRETGVHTLADSFPAHFKLGASLLLVLRLLGACLHRDLPT